MNNVEDDLTNVGLPLIRSNDREIPAKLRLRPGSNRRSRTTSCSSRSSSR